MGDIVDIKSGPKIMASMADIELANAGSPVDYTYIEGFTPDQQFRIGSITAGDLIEWQEANEGEAKRTAGLRLITKSLVGPEPDNIRYADDPKNIPKFRAIKVKVTERIVKEILKLNGMTVRGDNATKND